MSFEKHMEERLRCDVCNSLHFFVLRDNLWITISCADCQADQMRFKNEEKK